MSCLEITPRRDRHQINAIIFYPKDWLETFEGGLERETETEEEEVSQSKRETKINAKRRTAGLNLGRNRRVTAGIKAK